MTDRDMAILRHVALYRITFRSVLEPMFFSGANCGDVLKRLRADRLLVARQGLRGRLSYYQLTPAGAAIVGVSEGRARPFGPQALATHLGLLAFCCAGGVRRARLENVERFFGADAPKGDHCAEEAESRTCIYNAYVPELSTPLTTVVRTLKRHVADALKRDTVRPWIDNRLYGFVVLLGTDEKKHVLRERLGRERFGSRRLLERAHIRVEAVPAFQTGR
jgi:hypothetical protein